MKSERVASPGMFDSRNALRVRSGLDGPSGGSHTIVGVPHAWVNVIPIQSGLRAGLSDRMIPRAANVFTFIKFPEDISSTSHTLLCTYFSHLKDTMYPIGRHSLADSTNAYWFHWTQLDLAYLHSILYTTSFFYDNLKGEQSKRTEFHSYRTIQELNRQLADPTTALTDSTTTVVMGMALMAEGFGDVESAHLHIMGLKQIVALRGGMKSFANKPQLNPSFAGKSSLSLAKFSLS
ncbi:hypothetical protein HYQ44_007497 [Verticillium longisporum]|nr:hypothetical protein HYQ44_007497 [Verticillium longisporum]